MEHIKIMLLILRTQIQAFKGVCVLAHVCGHACALYTFQDSVFSFTVGPGHHSGHQTL